MLNRKRVLSSFGLIFSVMGLGSAAFASTVVTCPTTMHYTPSISCTYATGFSPAGACAQGVRGVTASFYHIVLASDPGCGATNRCVVCQYTSPGISDPTYGNPVSQQKPLAVNSTCTVSGNVATCTP
jgi:hypothetical protein